MSYDSTEDTKRHIDLVGDFMLEVVSRLISRANDHDASKLESPEKEIFDRYRPVLRQFKYDGPEYMTAIENIRQALDHHYRNNTHHPEHYENGIAGMSLLDLIEMFCDWYAAAEEQEGGSLTQSLAVNRGRFKLSNELFSIFKNTQREMGWS